LSEHEDQGIALSSWTFGVSEQIAILVLLAYGGSIAVGGNGFVATFAGHPARAATRSRLEAGDELEAATGRSAAIGDSPLGRPVSAFPGVVFGCERPGVPGL
jgi:hypothetical protein